MKNFLKLFAFLSMMLIVLNACQDEKNDFFQDEKNDLSLKSTATDCSHTHWSYEGEEPEYWEYLCPGWSDCGGNSQSPINICGAKPDKNLEELEFNYTRTTTNIVNNGHTVQFNCDKGSSLIVENENDVEKKYELLQFHYHGLSEHEVCGKQYPLEVHFVHKATDGSIAVIGIFFAKGKSNPLFSKYLKKFPHHEGEYSSNGIISLKTLLPKSDDYYTYSGSLTTPPCSEIVTWYVMKKPIEASDEQIKEFSEILHNNFRPVQPLNGRIIKEYKD